MQAIKTAVVYVMVMASVASAAEYPVAFLAYPRTTGIFETQSVSERSGQHVYHVGTDLMVADPDGTERVLVSGSQPSLGLLAVHDFCVSLNGQSIIYSHIRTISPAPGIWCDLYRVNVATGQTVRLTDALNEWNPPRGAAQFTQGIPASQNAANDDRVNKGLHWETVWNIGPCECGDGSIVFCSTRNAMRAPAEGSQPAFQLFRMDANGAHCHLIGHMNLSGALHPTITRSGKLYWSSSEQQGGRTAFGNGWAIWSINPDGSDWGPEISSIGKETPFHFQTETTDGSLVSAQYYDTRMYGAIRVAPPFTPDPFGPPTKFGNPLWYKETPLKDGTQSVVFGYKRRGFYTLAPWAWVQDQENRNAAGTEKPGMISHPAAVPNNGILLTWTGSQGDAAMNLGIYAVPDITQPSQHFSDLVPVVDSPTRHEWMARPVVPFAAIYGLTTPPIPKGLTDPKLPPGSPFATVSTSSMSWPEIVSPQFGPSTGLPVFKNFSLADAQYIRVLAFNKTTTNRSYMFQTSELTANLANRNTDGFHSAFNERCGSYGEVPLYKYRTPTGTVHYGPNPPDGSTPILDPEGKPDTSFELQLPANQPWTFQVLNAKKESVGTAQSWHQVIPGEYRTCGGCHTHFGRVPFEFAQSFAASEEYVVQRLDNIRTSVWGRDIKPIVDQHSLPITQFGWKNGIPFYRSSETTVDDDPRLTQSQAEAIRLWIDTGMMSEGVMYDYKRRTPSLTRAIVESDRLGPYADTQAPTVAHTVFPDRIILGLFDPQAGLDVASLSVTCSQEIAGRAAGAELAELFSRDEHRWILTTTVPQTARLTVSVRDLQVGVNLYGEAVGPGNLTKSSFPLTPDGTTPPIDPPPDPNAAEIARLQAEIAAIAEQISVLSSVRADLQSQLDALMAPNP